MSRTNNPSKRTAGAIIVFAFLLLDCLFVTIHATHMHHVVCTVVVTILTIRFLWQRRHYFTIEQFVLPVVVAPSTYVLRRTHTQLACMLVSRCLLFVKVQLLFERVLMQELRCKTAGPYSLACKIECWWSSLPATWLRGCLATLC